MGVVTGEMLVDGRQRDVSFQRKTGYVQQQDLHLETSTVREALRFSAILRQSKNVPMKEKLEYVEEVLKLLEMDSYADAVVGVPGEGTLICDSEKTALTYRSQCRTAKATHYRCRVGRQARPFALPRRTYFRIGLSDLVEHSPTTPKTHRTRSSYLVYHPPTFRHVV